MIEMNIAKKRHKHICGIQTLVKITHLFVQVAMRHGIKLGSGKIPINGLAYLKHLVGANRLPANAGFLLFRVVRRKAAGHDGNGHVRPFFGETSDGSADSQNFIVAMGSDYQHIHGHEVRPCDIASSSGSKRWTSKSRFMPSFE